MSREGIKEHDVFLACKMITDRKEFPTIEKIRSILQTGSNSTISHHLKKWKNTYQTHISIKNFRIKNDSSYAAGYRQATHDFKMAFDEALMKAFKIEKEKLK